MISRLNYIPRAMRVALDDVEPQWVREELERLIVELEGELAGISDADDFLQRQAEQTRAVERTKLQPAPLEVVADGD